MKPRFSNLFSLVLLILTLSACSKCGNDTNSEKVPKTLRGNSLVGQVTQGSGSFANSIGYSFTTTFPTSNHFQSVNSNNAIESKGNYLYVVSGKDTARLTLTDSSGLHADEQIEVSLKFTTPNSGTYVAKLLSGQQGEHSGTFELM